MVAWPRAKSPRDGRAQRLGYLASPGRGRSLRPLGRSPRGVASLARRGWVSWPWAQKLSLCNLRLHESVIEAIRRLGSAEQRVSAFALKSYVWARLACPSMVCTNWLASLGVNEDGVFDVLVPPVVHGAVVVANRTVFTM